MVCWLNFANQSILDGVFGIFDRNSRRSVDQPFIDQNEVLREVIDDRLHLARGGDFEAATHQIGDAPG